MAAAPGAGVSKHWNPEEELTRTREAPPKSSWPEGATVGLLMVAAACLGFAALLYQIAGPRDVFAP